MGMRIHKILGYGLDDVQHEGGRITDPRINVSGHLLMAPDQVGPEYRAHLEKLRDAEREHSDAWFDIETEIQLLRATPGRLDWPVTWECEYGRQDVLLIRPMAFGKWSRYDDPIDYAEECALHEDPTAPRVVPLPQGIWPFESLYMDSRDGRRLDGTVKWVFDRLMHGKTDGPTPEQRRAVDHLAHRLGFDDADQARTCIVPWVPGDVRRIASWGSLFTEPDVWLKLRPMLYVYWS